MKRLYQSGESAPAIRFLLACRAIRHRKYAGYSIAALSLCAGLGTQWLFAAHYEGAPFLNLYLAVVIAALFGGGVSGFIVAAIDGVAQWAVFIPKLHLLAVATYAFDATVCVLLIDFVNRSFDLMFVMIDEQTQVAQRQKLLNRELHHRIQNLFTVITAVIRLSLHGSGTVEKTWVRDRLTDRLHAMSVTNLAITDSGGNVMLQDLIAKEIHGFESRFDTIGPGQSIVLDPQTAQNVSLLLHELVVNAMKYGALSNQEGRVNLWLLVRGSSLTITWREQGGPPVEPPQRNGFGSRLLSKFAKGIGYQVEEQYQRGGLRYSIRIPLKTEIEAATYDDAAA